MFKNTKCVMNLAVTISRHYRRVKSNHVYMNFCDKLSYVVNSDTQNDGML